MRFLLACGGSGGHINPALSVARLLRDDGHETLFVGAPQGLEGKLVPREGFPIDFIEVRSLSHSVSPKAFVRNANVALKMAGALRASERIIQKFKPDAALGMGGYASYPPLRAAAKMGIPTFVHESNAIPGVTTRLLAKKAEKILVGMEACRKAYDRQDKVLVVGTPVRGEFFNTDRMRAREALRLDNRPLVLSFFGSQGARDMNNMMLELLAREQESGLWQHIHVTGPKPYDAQKRRAEEMGLRLENGLRLEEYLYNMPEAMTAADLIICRSGASTLAELAACRRPSVLVPSTHVTGDHQTANAKAFSASGGAFMKPESELNALSLFAFIEELLQNKERLDTMKSRLGEVAVPDSARRIQALLYEAARGS